MWIWFNVNLILTHNLFAKKSEGNYFFGIERFILEKVKNGDCNTWNYLILLFLGTEIIRAAWTTLVSLERANVEFDIQPVAFSRQYEKQNGAMNKTTFPPAQRDDKRHSTLLFKGISRGNASG